MSGARGCVLYCMPVLDNYNHNPSAFTFGAQKRPKLQAKSNRGWAIFIGLVFASYEQSEHTENAPC